MYTNRGGSCVAIPRTGFYLAVLTVVLTDSFYGGIFYHIYIALFLIRVMTLAHRLKA